MRILQAGPGLLVGDDTLVVADLHLGYEQELAQRGVKLPPQAPRLLQKLRELVAVAGARRLILLGDVKHGTVGIQPQEWRAIPEFFDVLMGLVERVELVPGNHDGGLEGLLPREVVIHRPEGIVVEDPAGPVALLHGHAWPHPQLLGASRMVMGHHHYTVELKDPSGLRRLEPVWVVAPCHPDLLAEAYLKAQGLKPGPQPLHQVSERWGTRVALQELVILPAFNPLLKGTPINRPDPHQHALSPLTRTRAIDLHQAELYLTDGTYLGQARLLGEER